MPGQREDYSWSECGEMVACPGVWSSLEEWGDAIGLSEDDVRYLEAEIDGDGIVRVTVAMFDSLVSMIAWHRENA